MKRIERLHKLAFLFQILLCIAIIATVRGGILPGIQHQMPISSAVVHSRTIYGGAIGGNPSNGAFSAAQYSQTVSAPAHVQSVISTHHPNNYGNNQENQHYYQHQNNQGSQGQGYHGGASRGGQIGQQSGGSSLNHPDVIAFGLYNSGQQHQGQGYGGSQNEVYGNNQAFFGQGSSGQGQGENNQSHVGQRTSSHGHGVFQNSVRQYDSVHSTQYNSRYYW